MNEIILVEVVFLQPYIELKKEVKASGKKRRIISEYRPGDCAVYISEDPMLTWLINNKMAVESRRANRLTIEGYDQGSPVSRSILEPVVQEIEKPKKKVVRKVSAKQKRLK